MDAAGIMVTDTFTHTTTAPLYMDVVRSLYSHSLSFSCAIRLTWLDYISIYSKCKPGTSVMVTINCAMKYLPDINKINAGRPRPQLVTVLEQE